MKISLPVVQKNNGLIIYKGNSLLNNKPIVAIATNLDKPSNNSKTGNFIQTYIYSDNKLKPTDNLINGQDDSVCGDCVHREWKTCYVNLGQAGNNAYRAYLAGRYDIFDKDKHLHLFKNRLLRGGSYGEPAALPTSLWKLLCENTIGHTMYTHAWRYCDPSLKKYCMASVESETGFNKARKEGWKTFRVRRSDEPILPTEFVCPASQEAGKRLKCENCLACKGGERYNQYTPVIISHGLDWKSKRFNEMQKKMINKKKFRGLFNDS